MSGEARWIVSASASALHAADALAAGAAAVDPKLSAALADEAAALASDLAAVGLPSAWFFEHALPLAVRFDAPRQLAEVVMAKALGPRLTDAAAERLARRLTSLYAAYRTAHPSAVEELELRSEPLRQQWEARGPGLLAALARLTEAEIVVHAADVILVQPVLGGGGGAHLLYNSLHIEALLANPHDALPELARLGWLWAQLNLDLPKYQDHVGRDRLRQAGPLAVLPPLLAACQEMELVRFDRATLKAALAAWPTAPIEAEALLSWWETYQGSHPPWAVALAALDRMLAA